LSLGLVALPARATPPSDRADAEGLAATAAVLVEQGDYVHACAKYDASARLDPNARRYLKLADCFERAGMIARAWMAFGDAQEWAESRGDRALAQTGRDNIKRLEPKLARIAVVVPPESEVEGLRVTRDGALVSAAVRGVPVVVDSGAHVISAGAPGRRAWSTTIELSPGKSAKRWLSPSGETRRTRVAPFAPPPMASLYNRRGCSRQRSRARPTRRPKATLERRSEPLPGSSVASEWPASPRRRLSLCKPARRAIH
jgi:hypothetical protein